VIRERESDKRDRERSEVRRGEIMLVMTLEQRYVSEPIETRYLKC
jgi:hypothetical protein